MVLDNRGFGCINRLQQACGGAPFNNLLVDCIRAAETPPVVDFAAHAIALGARGENVATIAELTQLRFLYKASGDRMVVIPPGVDVGHFYPISPDEAKLYVGLKPDDRMALFVGRIEPLKGVDTLIQAMSCLKWKDVEPVHLAIIGGNPSASPREMSTEMARLQKLCDDLCVGQTVVFLGQRDQDKLPYYYSAAEVVVMPSHYESFGMVALEAMACGTPVIASDVGGLSHLVRDGITGFHVPNGDHVALASTLARLLQDEVLRRKLGQQAWGWAQGYSWAKIGDRVTLRSNVWPTSTSWIAWTRTRSPLSWPG